MSSQEPCESEGGVEPPRSCFYFPILKPEWHHGNKVIKRIKGVCCAALYKKINFLCDKKGEKSQFWHFIDRSLDVITFSGWFRLSSYNLQNKSTKETVGKVTKIDLYFKPSQHSTYPRRHPRRAANLDRAVESWTSSRNELCSLALSLPPSLALEEQLCPVRQEEDGCSRGVKTCTRTRGRLTQSEKCCMATVHKGTRFLRMYVSSMLGVFMCVCVSHRQTFIPH